MTCPQCTTPMLFGTQTCECGYTPPKTKPQKTVEDSAIELYYFEALRAYWRLYWPSLILVLIGASVFRSGTQLDTVVSALFWGVGLILFVSRITSRPYRGFSIAMRELSTGTVKSRMTMTERLDIFAFLWWKQLIPFGIASLVATALGGVGISRLAAGLILQICVVLLIGPILLKSMIIDPFETFQIFVQRKRTADTVQSAPR